ncbi:glycosyl transferase [Agaricicola taiwanensis]|uniref:Glycosyl transferase n=1 Tax=Agaricicola taiwanensis TaxID=591372 RepID=A0A8J2YKJ8_9RHOB|nr:glycosyltransferase family 4 protein [Agaricicola taiwanensis]GGE48828.1 glycosyl transferase [Agaricicola taiwanensis]
MAQTPRALKIAIFVSFANVAGAQIAALRLAHGLKDKGHDVTVRFLYEQVPVNSTDHPHEVVLKTARPGVKGYLKIVRTVYQTLKREKPDVVLTFLPLACVIGQTCAWAAGIKTRVVSHRMPINTASSVMRKLDLLLAWAGAYTKVICVSNAVRATCRNYPKWLLDRTVVVHNGLLGFVPSLLSKADARARFGIPADQFTLVAIGRFVPQKHYPLMLEVVSRLDDVLLVIGGDGFLRQSLEAEIARLGIGHKVKLLGNVGRADVPDLLQAGDAFIQTSTYEGQSNTVLEGLTAGIPMVLHDVPEQRETIEDPQTGKLAGELVPLNDVDGWVAAIERLRRDTSSRDAASEQARRQAQLFTYDRMIDGFNRTLQPEQP